jgi:hypothetical protein
MHCTACGCEFADTSVFCPRCGVAASHTEQQTAATPFSAGRLPTQTPPQLRREGAKKRRNARICIASLALGLVSALCFATSFSARVPLVGGPGYGAFVSLLTMPPAFVLGIIGLSLPSSRKKLAIFAACLSVAVFMGFVARFMWMAVNAR